MARNAPWATVKDRGAPRRALLLAAGLGLIAALVGDAAPGLAADSPLLSVVAPTVLEGNPGPAVLPLGPPTPMDYVVNLRPASSDRVTVEYGFSSTPLPWVEKGGLGLAAPTNDTEYTAPNGTLVFLPGETSKVVTVQVTADARVEDYDTEAPGTQPLQIVMWLRYPTGAGLAFDSEHPADLARYEAAGSVIDDDVGPLVRLSAPWVDEVNPPGSSTLSFSASLVDVPPGFAAPVTYAWETAPPLGVSSAQSAYSLVSTLSQAAGVLRWDSDPATPDPPYGAIQTIPVLVPGDTLVEGNRCVSMGGDKLVNSGLYANRYNVGTIIDDDDPVTWPPPPLCSHPY